MEDYTVFDTVLVTINRAFILERTLNRLHQNGFEIVTVYPEKFMAKITATGPAFVEAVKVVVKYDSASSDKAAKLNEIKQSI